MNGRARRGERGGSGGRFTPRERSLIDVAIRDAETARRLEFSVYVGPLPPAGDRQAPQLHASMAAPDRSVLLAVDPTSRQLSIVTGTFARRALGDAFVASVAHSVVPRFAGDDVVGGIVEGLSLLARA
jgi:hypothetical protein